MLFSGFSFGVAPIYVPNFLIFTDYSYILQTGNTFLCVCNQKDKKRGLSLIRKQFDVYVSCSLELSEWRGQNQRTLAVGLFPACLTVPAVTAATPSSAGPNPAASAPHISAPMKGSLQHTGHGDVHPDRTWGTPERLEESVLLLHSPLLSYVDQHL